MPKSRRLYLHLRKCQTNLYWGASHKTISDILKRIINLAEARKAGTFSRRTENKAADRLDAEPGGVGRGQDRAPKAVIETREHAMSVSRKLHCTRTDSPRPESGSSGLENTALVLGKHVLRTVRTDAATPVLERVRKCVCVNVCV